MPSILTVDNHEIFRYGLKHLLRQEFRGLTFGDAKNSDAAIRCLKGRVWDMIILSCALSDRNGFDVLQEIRRLDLNSKVLVVCEAVDGLRAIMLIRDGAYGCIARTISVSELLKAVRKVLSGRQYISRAHSSALAANHANADARRELRYADLSTREKQVLFGLVAGKTIGAIAAELRLSVKSISTYKRRVLNKFQIDSIAELVRYAIKHDLVPAN